MSELRGDRVGVLQALQSDPAPLARVEAFVPYPVAPPRAAPGRLFSCSFDLIDILSEAAREDRDIDGIGMLGLPVLVRPLLLWAMIALLEQVSRRSKREAGNDVG